MSDWKRTRDVKIREMVTFSQWMILTLKGRRHFKNGFAEWGLIFTNVHLGDFKHSHFLDANSSEESRGLTHVNSSLLRVRGSRALTAPAGLALQLPNWNNLSFILLLICMLGLCQRLYFCNSLQIRKLTRRTVTRPTAYFLIIYVTFINLVFPLPVNNLKGKHSLPDVTALFLCVTFLIKQSCRDDCF